MTPAEMESYKLYVHATTGTYGTAQFKLDYYTRVATTRHDMYLKTHATFAACARQVDDVNTRVKCTRAHTRRLFSAVRSWFARIARFAQTALVHFDLHELHSCILGRDRPIMLIFYLLCYAAVLINLTFYAQNYAHHKYDNALVSRIQTLFSWSAPKAR